MDRISLAKDYFLNGYNCAQSILLAFLDETGLDKETALRISSSFGGGMGRLREVCGAVSGMFIVLGLKYGYTSNNDGEAKKNHYVAVQTLANEFKKKNGAYVCRELLALPQGSSDPIPEKRTEKYYAKRPCAELVGDAAEILENYIKRNSEK